MDNENLDKAPYSIHNIVKEGLNIGRKPGDWYGP